MLWASGRENVMERDFYINNDTVKRQPLTGSGSASYTFYGMASEITRSNDGWMRRKGTIAAEKDVYKNKEREKL